MLIKTPIPKQNLVFVVLKIFVGGASIIFLEAEGWVYKNVEGHTGVQTDVQRGGGSQVMCHLSVQCNVVQSSSIVQVSLAVGWFTKTQKIKKSKKKKNHRDGKKEKKNKSVSSQAKISNMVFVKNFFQHLEESVL